MTLYQRLETVRDFNGVVVSRANVKVVVGLTYSDTATLAALYQDSDGLIPIANPVQADAAGRYSYWAAEGYYSEQVSRPGYVSATEDGFHIGAQEGPPGPQGAPGPAGPDLSPQLASTSNPAYGSGMVGFNPALAYAANTVGNELKGIRSDLSESGDPVTGAGMIGYADLVGYDPGTVGDAISDRAKSSDLDINVKALGAKGDGVTDDTSIIQSAIASGKTVYFPAGTYLISSALSVTNDNTQLVGAGIGVTTIKAKSGVAFEYMLTANSLNAIWARHMTFDANQAGRAAALQGASMRGCGPVLTSCNDSGFESCLVKNTLGSVSAPGVGFGFGGNGLRNRIVNCAAVDCGIVGYASDGFYTSGTQTLIVGCVAKNCMDTGFVLEMSNYSGIIGCSSHGCSSVAAITATGSDCYGNFIDGLTGYGWNSAVTGGVQIEALGSGNLYDSSIKGLVMVNGTGPAVNFRKTSTGRIVNTTLECHIDTGTTQGILIDGCDELLVKGASVKGTVNACIQVQTGCTKILVDGCKLWPTGPGTYGFDSTDGTDIVVKDCEIFATAGQMSYGVYFFGTGTRCFSIMNKSIGHTNAATGADGSTTPIVVAPLTTGSGLTFGKAAATNLYDVAGVLQTDNAFLSASTVKARGNLMEVGPTGSSSGNGGSFRTRNDAGTSSWLVGHLGSVGHTAFNIRDVVNGDDVLSVAQGSGGAIIIGRIMKTIAAQESTGAGSAALGANCPAVTLTAPYKWLKFNTSDGSTVYVPSWK